MKRILITTGIYTPDIGGPASYAELLSDKLSQDFKITILTYSSVFNYKKDKDKNFKIVRVWRGWPKGIRHLIYLSKCFSLGSKNETIFSLNAVSAGWPASVVAKMLKKKFIVKIVGDYAWEQAMNRRATDLLIDDFQNSKKTGSIARLDKMQKKVCKKAKLVIVPSSYLAGIVEGWGVEPSKVRVIYNSVDLEPLEINREDARNKIGIHGNILLSIGRLVPWKGFRMLIKIMPKLLEINQFFRLVIVGDGPDMKNLQAIVKNLGLDKKVYIVGKKSHEELRLCLASADLFVLNTGYEGFSHQILEAMQAGLPVITTLVGGNKEIIKQGENGFMVKYNDEFNLIEAIKSLWDHPEVREEFISSGFDTVKGFSIDRMVRETSEILGL